MEIPLHPEVVATMAAGREFRDIIAGAQRDIDTARIPIESPEGDITITFGGNGAIAGSTFSDDVLDKYRGDELSEMLTVMCELGYEKVGQHIDEAAAVALSSWHAGSGA